MSQVLADCFWLCFVAALWGVTNPFIKKGGEGIEKIKRENAVMQFLGEIKFLVFNWKAYLQVEVLCTCILEFGYMVPFLINQSGSIVFYLTLASADLSIAVPITNSLTFLITTITGQLMGEKQVKTGAYAGMVLVVFGVYLCVTAQP